MWEIFPGELWPAGGLKRLFEAGLTPKRRLFEEETPCPVFPMFQTISN
jgi:hypothetical protein